MISGVSSNYMSGISNMYRYNYNTMKSSYSDYNNAGVGSKKQNYVNTDAVKYLTSIKASAKSMLDSLSNANKSSFLDKMQAVSSNAESVAVNSSDKVQEDFKDTEIDVQQVASGQQNEGTALRSNAAFERSGSQRFEIEIDGKRNQFAVDVKAGDTNRAVQQKLADAINSRNLGITASVSQSEDGKTSALSIRSDNTGADEKNSFSIRDTSGSLVSATGASTMKQAAQDAVYRVNGEQRTSGSNDIDLGKGVSVTLKNATSETATISVERRTPAQAQANAMRDVVDSYNSFLSSAKATNANSRLSNDLSNIYRSYAPMLARAGVTAGEDGTLKIDENKLTKAAENGSLRDLMAPASGSYGFSNRLTQTANKASFNPLTYQTATANNTSSVGSLPSAQNLQSNYQQSAKSYDYVNNYMFGTSASNSLTSGYLFNLYA